MGTKPGMAPAILLGDAEASQPPNRILRSALDRGRRSYSLGEPGAAVEALREALPSSSLSPRAGRTQEEEGEIGPLIRSALVTLGLSYLALDQDELARAQFDRAVELFDDAAASGGAGASVMLPHDEAEYGVALEVVGRLGEAIGRLRQAIAGGADMPEAQRHLGRALVRASVGATAKVACQEAEQALRQAVERLPNDPITLVALGGLLADGEPRGHAEAVEILVRAASELGRRGRLAEADTQFRRATELAPDDLSANLGRAETLRLVGNPQDALVYAERAMTLAPGDPRVRVVLSTILTQTGESAKALVVAEQGLELAPSSQELKVCATAALDALNRNEEAIARLRRWIEDDPDWAWGLVVLGEQLRREGLDEEALEVLGRGVELFPDSAYAVGTYGQVLLVLGHAEAAESQLRHALELDPVAGWIAIDLGQALVDLKRASDAVDVLESLRQTSPNEPGLPERYAAALLADGRIDDAIALLLPFAEADSPSPGILSTLGDAYRVRGGDEDVQAGEAVLRRVLELDPSSAFAHGTLGALMAQAERYDEALPHLERAVDLEGDYAFAWRWRGTVLLATSRFEEAEAALLCAVDVDRGSSLAWSLLGETQRMLSRNGDAIDSFDEAHRLEHDDVFPLVGKGQVLTAMGRYEEAVLTLDAALALDQSWPLALAEKGDALRALGRFDDAFAVLERALELTDDRWVRTSHGATLLGLGRYSEALVELDAVLTADGNDYIALIKSGELRSDIADFEGAWRLLRRAAVIDDNSQAWVQGQLGWVAHQRGDGDAAYEYACAAAELEPLIGYHGFVADILQSLGQHEAAAAKYHDTIEFAQQQDGELSAWDLWAVGLCFMGLKSYDEAARALRSASEANSTPPLLCDLALAVFCSGRAELGLKEYERAFDDSARQHPWRRYAILATARTDLRLHLETPALPLSPTEVRRAKRRIGHELRIAKVDRYVVPADPAEQESVGKRPN